MRRPRIRRNISICLLVCGACVMPMWTIPPLAAAAPQQSTSTRIIGEVLHRSTRQPLGGAEVRLIGDTNLSTFTSSDGRFEFFSVAVGQYRIEVRVRNSVVGSTIVHAADMARRVTILLDTSGQAASPPPRGSVAVRELQIPSRAFTAFRAGLREIEKGRPQRSVAHFERAITLHSNYDEAYVQLALVLLEQGRNGDAIRVLKTALARNAGNYRAYALLGSALYRAKRLNEAEMYLRESIRIRDTLATPHFNLARILLLRKATGGALVHARRAHELHEADIQNHLLLYEVHLLRGETQEALAELDDILKRFADHPEIPKLRKARERLLSLAKKD